MSMLLLHIIIINCISVLHCQPCHDGSSSSDDDARYLLPALKHIGMIANVLENEQMQRGLELGPSRGIYSASILQSWPSCQQYTILEAVVHTKQRLQAYKVAYSTVDKQDVDFVFINSMGTAAETMVLVGKAWKMVKPNGIVAGSKFIGDDALVEFVAFHQHQLLVTYKDVPWRCWYFRKRTLRYQPLALLKKRELFGLLLNSENKEIGAEVGVWQGVFSHELLLKWGKCTRFWAIDAWKSPTDGRYQDGANVGDDVHHENMQMAQSLLSKFSGQVDVQFVKEESKIAAETVIDNELLDFVYIDGRHDYDSVLSDLNSYWIKVKEGGIIAGHDFMQQSDLQLLEGNFQNWGLCADGRIEPRAVVGAVNDFSASKGVQVVVTFGDDAIPSWYFRKSSLNNTKGNAPLSPAAAAAANTHLPTIILPKDGYIFRSSSDLPHPVTCLVSFDHPLPEPHTLFLYLDKSHVSKIDTPGQISITAMVNVGVHEIHAIVCTTASPNIGPHCLSVTHIIEIRESNPLMIVPMVTLCTWTATRVTKDHPGMEHLQMMLSLIEEAGVSEDHVHWVTDKAIEISEYPMLEMVVDGRRDYACLMASVEELLSSNHSHALVVLPQAEHNAGLLRMLLKVEANLMDFRQKLSQYDIVCARRCDQRLHKEAFIMSRITAEALHQLKTPFEMTGDDEISLHIQLLRLKMLSMINVEDIEDEI